jgi:hypothetical protein
MRIGFLSLAVAEQLSPMLSKNMDAFTEAVGKTSRRPFWKDIRSGWLPRNNRPHKSDPERWMQPVEAAIPPFPTECWGMGSTIASKARTNKSLPRR